MISDGRIDWHAGRLADGGCRATRGRAEFGRREDRSDGSAPDGADGEVEQSCSAGDVDLEMEVRELRRPKHTNVTGGDDAADWSGLASREARVYQLGDTSLCLG